MHGFTINFLRLIGLTSYGRLNRPFNGQALRRELFEELFLKFNFKSVVETGTFKGWTTAYLAQFTKVPVYSVDINVLYYLYSRLSLRRYDNVRLFNGNSIKFLKKLQNDKAFPKENVFFYLDAHWNKNLPLKDELSLILSSWKRSIILIDDFKVPRDEGYAFDVYNGETLDVDYIEKISLKKFNIFWPAYSSRLETGARRGAVILSTPDMPHSEFSTLRCLRAN